MDLIVTGDIHSGKTTWCSKYLAGRTAIKAGGVLCPVAYSYGLKTGYNAMDISSGEKVPFARFSHDETFSGETVGEYKVSFAGISFVERTILKAVNSGCELILMDEIGHLELQGRGIIKAVLQAYLAGIDTIAVVRSALVPRFISYLDDRSIYKRFAFVLPE